MFTGISAVLQLAVLGALLMFITGLPILFFGACLGMLAEKVEKSIDRYFERRVAKRGHRL